MVRRRPGPTRMLLDEHLPRFDFVERHGVRVSAGPAAAFAAIRSAELLRGPVTRVLVFLRGLPGLLVAPRETARRFLRGRAVTIDTLVSAGFVVLGEEPDREVVLGTIGRFWRPSGGVRAFARGEFARFDEPGWAKAAFNFRVEPAPGGGADVSTETRVLCTDARSRRAFRRYWCIVRPFSGMIRIEMLRTIRQQVERVER